METVEVGDVVKLKSGGPKMTVKKTKTNAVGQRLTVTVAGDLQYCVCQWFSEENKLEDGIFPNNSLEKS